MNIQLAPGAYVVAVSGGVDSVALLHTLQEMPELTLTVAHFDHGIREDSREDRLLVQSLAQGYGLPFVYDEGRLGPAASEATAREARYDFLHKTRRDNGARAIVTAHHQDDVLETAIINMLRGSGRKGLTALADRSDVQRPLLHIPKQELIEYAKAHNLAWREDSTNQDERYLRNYVRRRLVPRFSQADREQLVKTIENLRTINHQLDVALANQLHLQTYAGTLDRDWFSHLPHDVAREVMAAWLRANGIKEFDSRALERLIVAAKTASDGKQIDVLKGVILRVNRENLALELPER